MAVCHVGPRSFAPLLVTVDKFTKWIEARLLAKIGSKQAVNFIQDIVFHFGVRNSIITNNGTHFTGEKFLDLCDNHNNLGGLGRGRPSMHNWTGRACQ
jgi:hypothetical protein